MKTDTLRWSCILLPVLALATPWEAHALQPLEAFVRSARQRSPDNAEARANLDQQQAQADVALGRVLPGISAKGNYIRNQYQSEVSFSLDPTAPPQIIVLTPRNLWTGSVTITVPLVDLAGFARVAATRTGAEASAQQAQATVLQVESQVVQNYFQLLANLSLVLSSERALELAKTSRKLTQAQFDAGTSTGLDVQRAIAEVERQTQLLESAKLQVALASRSLESASGLAPESLSPVSLDDDLHEEADLETFSPPDEDLPSLAAAMKNRKAAEQQALAQKLTFVPVVSGSFVESATSAPGFVGHNYVWQAGLGATWQLDLTTFANVRSQDAAADAARAREQRARLFARDAIHRYWNTVHSSIAGARSARAQAKASEQASRMAKDRYEVGASTQLELLQAQRDAYGADVARIQSDADLANARTQLRLAAGRDVFADRSK
jgi:outer membrane protein TolC